MNKLPDTLPESHHDILSGNNFAQVAMVMPGGMLANNTVAFLWDGKSVRFSTLKSRQKYRNLKRDNRVALCISDPANPWRYLEIRGTVDIEDDKDRSFINRIAKKYMNKDVYPFDKPDDERVTFTVKPTRVRAEYVHMDKGNPENIGVKR